jgi:antitoxin VapB
MSEVREAKIFKNGRSRAVRIPREFDSFGDVAILRQVGDTVVIEPKRRNRLAEFLRTLEPIDEDLPEIEDLPAEPVDL